MKGKGKERIASRVQFANVTGTALAKCPYTKNIQVVYRHKKLTVNGVLNNFIEKGD